MYVWTQVSPLGLEGGSQEVPGNAGLLRAPGRFKPGPCSVDPTYFIQIIQAHKYRIPPDWTAHREGRLLPLPTLLSLIFKPSRGCLELSSEFYRLCYIPQDVKKTTLKIENPGIQKMNLQLRAFAAGLEPRSQHPHGLFINA